MNTRKSNNAVAIADTIDRHLDELIKWGSQFRTYRATDHTIEVTFDDGCRVVIRISNATPNKS